jgi:hypothetical protein
MQAAWVPLGLLAQQEHRDILEVLAQQDMPALLVLLVLPVLLGCVDTVGPWAPLAPLESRATQDQRVSLAQQVFGDTQEVLVLPEYMDIQDQRVPLVQQVQQVFRATVEAPDLSVVPVIGAVQGIQDQRVPLVQQVFRATQDQRVLQAPPAQLALLGRKATLAAQVLLGRREFPETA